MNSAGNQDGIVPEGTPGAYVAVVDFGGMVGFQEVSFESRTAYKRFLKEQKEAHARRAEEEKRALDQRDWARLSGWCSSEGRITRLSELWPSIPRRDRSKALVEFYGAADYPSQHTEFLIDAFRRRRVFDSSAARSAYEAAPETVTVYRGTNLEEADAAADDVCVGVSWTIERDVANFFATKHFRFRRTDEPAVILRARICKKQIRGWFWQRNESEVIVTDHVDFDVTQC